MGLDIVAWSHLQLWNPALETLTSLGLSSSQETFTVEPRHDPGLSEVGLDWMNPESGTYWTTQETDTFSFWIGSYAFWDAWKSTLAKRLPIEAHADWLPFLHQARLEVGDIWNSAACEHLDRLFSRWEGHVLCSLTPAEAEEFEPTWRKFQRAWRIGAQSGAVMII